MAEVLQLQQLSLARGANALSMSLEPGSLLMVVGPSGSGKSMLISTLAGHSGPAKGKVITKGKASEPEYFEGKKAIRVDQFLNQAKGSKKELVGECLYACGLWSVRESATNELSFAQESALATAAALSRQASLVLLDGHLDALDDWTLSSLWPYLHKRLTAGLSVVLATNRLDFLAEADAIIVMDKKSFRFYGTIRDLMRKAPPSQMLVRTENRLGVRALLQPFEVHLRETDEGLMIQSPQGQKVAAELLSRGYNDVQFVIQNGPSPADAVRAILAGNPAS